MRKIKFLLSAFVISILSGSVFAKPVSIIDISPFPEQVNAGETYYGIYQLNAIPNQTIVFENDFPGDITQITDGEFCQMKNKMDSSGMCIINLKLEAPQIAGSLNPVIKVRIDGTPISYRHEAPVKIVAAADHD
jgi:hypothetical protein